MSFNNSTQCRIIKAAANSVFIISIVWSMIDRQYPCSWFQQKEEENKCGWNMQEKRNPI